MWNDYKFLWLLFATALVGILEFLALAGIHLPSSIGIPFFLLFILLIGHQTLWHGLYALASFNFKSINALMLIAVLGACFLGQYEEAAVVIVLYTLAEKLEEIGMDRSQSALNSLIKKMPKFVQLKDQDLQVPVHEVKVGQLIVVKPGEMIPLDGRVVAGSSFVDESTITGEPIPQDKLPDDHVYAGTLNKQGYLEIEVTKKFEQTTFAKIQELTFHAAKFKAPTQKFMEKFSQYYTPIVIILALLWVIIPVIGLGYPLAPWLTQGLTLIVIACPCALVISIPISIYSAIGNASKQGILIKGGKYLEALSQLRAIAFDKTRTLTYGRPIVSDIIPYGKHSKEHLLECAAGIEIFSEHPLAQSIVEAAKKENLSPHFVENFKSILGKGVQADCLICSDKHHCLGKLSFILEEHHVPQMIIDEIEMLQKQGKIPVIIATHHEIEGVIALTDEIRPDSLPLIQELQKLHILPILLTGDHLFSAEAIANQLGIHEFKAELLPEDKANMIQKLVKKYQVVGMVGDGVNDAPALALANVGITMSSIGSDTAIEAAPIVILNQQLNKIPFLIRLGKKTLQIIYLNVTLAIAIKFIFIILALLGISHLALAIFADVGVTLIVILISLSLLNYSR